MFGFKRKKVEYVDTDPSKTIPKEMMPGANRHQRRAMAAMQRKKPARGSNFTKPKRRKK